MFAVVIATVLSLLFIYLLKKTTTRSPPGPWGLPILGYYPFLGENPFVKFQQLSEKYGDIMKVNLLNKDYYFLNSLELIKEAFVTKGDNFAGRPKGEFYMLNHIEGDKSVGNAEGKFWEVLQKFFVSSLSGVGMGKSEFESRIHDACELTVNNIRQEIGKPFDPYKHFKNYTSNVTSVVLFSKIYNYDDPDYVRIQEIFESMGQCVEYLDAFLSGPIFYIMKRIEGKAYNIGRRLGKEIHDHMGDILNKIIKERGDEEYSDVLHFFRKEMKGRNSEYFTTDTMITNFYHLFIAGAETSAVTLYFCLNLMARHKQIQSKVQAEIDDVIGKDRLVSTQHRNLMPYTNAVLAEIRRYTCATPFGDVHVNKEQDTVGGYTIPKRSSVCANFWRLSRDKRFYKKTEEFYPENFLDENGQFKSIEANIVFGIGKRMCLGSKLAEVEIFIGFVTLMQKFEWYFPENKIPKMEVLEGGIRVCLPYELCVNER